jgi:PIN domain nuclease of toxin-antitoxin system
MESEPMKACLDAHAVLWSRAGDPKLGAKACKLIAAPTKTDIVISDMVLIEVAYLSAKGRINDADGLDVLLAKIVENFRVIPINPEIARLAVTPEMLHGDPFDRVIAATAKAHRIPLLTRDRSIKDSGVVEIIW